MKAVGLRQIMSRKDAAINNDNSMTVFFAAQYGIERCPQIRSGRDVLG